MKETLIKFSYEITGKSDDDNSGDIHIEGLGDPGGDTLCGIVNSGQEKKETDKMPTCSSCMEVYNMIKNGKLRR